MKLELFIAVLLVAVCIAAGQGEEEAVREKRQTKPGRFLALPNPQKCATRKCFIPFSILISFLN